jgi:hypothetical protein
VKCYSTEQVGEDGRHYYKHLSYFSKVTWFSDGSQNTNTILTGVMKKEVNSTFTLLFFPMMKAVKNSNVSISPSVGNTGKQSWIIYSWLRIH